MPSTARAEAERALYLGMVATLERDLVRALEHVLGELKGAAGRSEAEVWLKRQMEGPNA